MQSVIHYNNIMYTSYYFDSEYKTCKNIQFGKNYTFLICCGSIHFCLQTTIVALDPCGSCPYMTSYVVSLAHTTHPLVG
jgi:hypothetical protein